MQRFWRVVSVIAVIAVMSLIYFFSSQSAKESTETSGRIVEVILSITEPEYDSYSEEEQILAVRKVQRVVRKTAHFIEYAALGWVLTMMQTIWLQHKQISHTRIYLSSWLIGSLYAVTDELHQIFSDNRAAQITDVCLDSAGVIFGVITAAMLIRITQRKTGIQKP